MLGRIKRMPGPRWPPASQLVLLALAASRVSAVSQSLCANFNTGLAKSMGSTIWMTAGKCHDLCGGYAFGVVQDQSCWCSNIAPGDTTSAGSCGKACPGYPYENCGDNSKGLFGYIALGPNPSSTQGGSSPTANSPSNSPSPSQQPAPSPQTNSPSPVTVQDTVTASPPVSVVSVTPTTSVQTSISTTAKYIPVSIPISTSSTSTSSTSSSSSSSDTETPTPIVSVMTVTGQLKTMTITPTGQVAPTQTIVNTQAAANNGGFFSSPGKVAGTFVAVALIVVGLVAGLIFFLLRRRRQRGQEAIPSTAGSGTPQRRPSRMSQMGLLGAGGGSVSKGEKSSSGNPPTIQTSGWGPGTSAERSPADTLEKRSSYPRIVDQRLEPTALWNPLHDNGSHVSIRSFRDDQDYSRRMLRVANPDQ